MAASAQGSGPGSLVQQSSAAAHQHGNSLSQPVPAPNCKAQPPGLDLSKLQQILQNVFPSSQGVHPAQSGLASLSAAAAPSPAPPSQSRQPVWNSAAGAGVLHSSSSLAQAKTPPLPKVAGKLDHGFSLAAPDQGAAALTAVDKTYAQDTATLDPLLDVRRNVRPDCAGRLAGVLVGLKTAEGRHEALLAMLRTTPASVFMPVAYSHRCLDTLADWVRWAMSDRQTTILRLLLAVLLRLPIPPAMVHVGRLLKAVFGLQSYKTPSVCFSAMNLLHHWQQQDPTLWPMPHKKQQLPAPRAAFAASAAQQQQRQQQQQQQPKQTSLHLLTANQAPQGRPSAANGVSREPASLPAQPPAAKPFYRGIAGRLGMEQQGKSASARPITADEIVRIQEERKRKAAGALGKGPPSKTGRLDNSSLLAAASKRRAGPLRHGPAANGLSSPRLGQLLAKQHPLHKQEQQPAPLHAPKANGHSEQPGMPQGLHAGMLQALIDSMKKQSKHGAQPAGQNIQAGATAVNVALAAASQEHLAESGAQPSTEWYAPPEMAFQLEADMAPGRGQDSAERAVQQLRQRREVAAVYALPKLIPSSPGEPWENQASYADAAQGPAHVPLLPTDPEEAQTTHQWLTSVGLSERDIVGRGRLAS
ncbi:hypothetical protein CVIRNUC_005265 [Coccomyxa viridis]|uniref:Uncharacterized protein n=1 Tax=Coccomyxa viridis TaxID=1274662 RepID=A0AAV1I503_9CHLO|nr:hypothetical protein CVIRNUC_005265 [Coccomyxa viridis]